MRLVIILVVLTLTTFAAKAEALSVNANLVRDCFARVSLEEDHLDCVGDAANDCQKRSDVMDTRGIVECIVSETAVWEEIIGEEFRVALRRVDEIDDRTPLISDYLLAAQRAWETFRSAECHFLYAKWRDGSIRSVALASCWLSKTSARAIKLRHYQTHGS